MPTAPAEPICPSCEDPNRPASERWQRRHPGFCTLTLCDRCGQKFSRLADDVAVEPGDEIRLAGLYITLAGETWVQGERMFWFRTPMLAHATSRQEPTMRMMVRPVSVDSPATNGHLGAPAKNARASAPAAARGRATPRQSLKRARVGI